MAKITKAQTAKLAKLQADYDACANAVYAACGSDNLRFSDCFKLATDRVQGAYTRAYCDLGLYQDELIRAGRAYRGSFGTFMPN